MKISDKRISNRNLILILLFGNILLSLISIYIGFYSISIKEVFLTLINPLFNNNLINSAPQAVTIIFNIRLPRIFSALIIGAALAVSGAAYQGMFKNPLVSPDILGVSSGAGFGAALAISFGLPYYQVQLSAFIGGIIVVFLTDFISRRMKFNQIVNLILIGTMLNAVCTSLITLLKYIGDTNETLPAITFWLMGSLSKITKEGVIFTIIPMIVGFTIIYIMRWRINILTLGDEEAQSLGINPKLNRSIIIFGATLLSASAVCLGGIIGWIGLMIPHIGRKISGANYKTLYPITALLGSGFLLIMDNFARALLNIEIPISILTSFIGAPFFILLISKKEE